MPQPSAAQIADHFLGGGLVAANFDKHFEVNREPVLSRVKGYITARKAGGALLDVGCATGFFLANFAGNANWDAQGTELSRPAAAAARRQGLRVHIGDTRSAQLPDEEFDVISVLDAFYYFLRPALELAELRRILKPDGLLIMELPWANTRIWQRAAAIGTLLNRSRIPLLETSDHLFYYTPKSLSLLLGSCGFVVEAVRPLPANRQPRALRGLLWTAYGNFSQLLWRLSAGGLFLGPRFMVAAKKMPGKTPGTSAAECRGFAKES